ncbi:hypothetical protein L561_0226 [Bordetella pertussis STO1-CHOC-0019]|nr:hypothetical protein L548_0754 [Bordetella pertussis H921]ETH82795.1 hypothetical protein L559_0209 [Bordetella pertussis STO1-CHOC-0017]ETH87423.1 hypothetical protein L560_0270 [Bordetella pertussis STO1-CHOC-0018]ETH93285.1 hypothetical protein L561_0226 [Bordetella pertussis STO1-CHOC-0019]CFW44265.1 Uncharacterised protein [Bordetella pertussis]
MRRAVHPYFVLLSAMMPEWSVRGALRNARRPVSVSRFIRIRKSYIVYEYRRCW